MNKKLLSLFAAGIFFSSTAAQAVLLTMDELPFQSIDGLTISGVTFGFSSSDAYYNSGGPGTITYVDDPSIEGDSSGVLQLDFATPTATLSFGVALNYFGLLEPGFSVELFDSGLASLGVTDVDTDALIGFSEGQFAYSGIAVSRALIAFDTFVATRFAFDNLEFTADNNIPEPATLALLGLGLAGMTLSRRRVKA